MSPVAELRPAYPWFGGKRDAAGEVWSRFGKVNNYVEPFFGGGAVLLAAPWPAARVETINDIDGYVVNFWRAVRRDPDSVAAASEFPLFELELEARHKWLVRQPQKDEFLSRVRDDPEFYDAKYAAWWAAGLCMWIGGDWCCGEWFGRGDPRNRGGGVAVRDESYGGRRQGLCRPHGLQCVPLEGRAVWLRALSARLEGVRVCCGDWSRVCTRTPTTRHGLTAVFLDPPYSAGAGRHNSLYRCESQTVAHDAREWAVAHGDDPLFRIALCGYEDEHAMPESWSRLLWRANGGYANMISDGKGRANKARETIWFSPHCLAAHERGQLFQ